jgi:hypothetical protein
MEWVRDPYKVRRRNRTICILNRVTSGSRGAGSGFGSGRLKRDPAAS